MANYWQAKLALFSWGGLRAAVVNVDDVQGAALAAQLRARGDLAVWTLSCAATPVHVASHIEARHIQHGALGLCFEVVQGDQVYPLETALVGQYNVSNVLGVIACLRAMGHSLAEAVQACRLLPAVPGRMQAVGDAGEPLVVIDYAHTPDAVAQAVQALLPLAQSRGGALTCVLGCGGDRDAAKRPLMAAAAEQYAQHVVLTSDNPRSEAPQTILNQMCAGLQRKEQALVLVDRAVAIAQVVAEANVQDVVLLAGKGHETVQEIGGARLPFSDVLQAQRALQVRTPNATGVAA
jgi:UDP-N-acetylmuramyl-tripeptide synthetase